jgi:excisionase family DNA binding protein
MDSKHVPLMSVPQFADALGITRSCVRRWILLRQIATIKLGRSVRIPCTEIDRLISSGSRPVRSAR